MYAAWYRDIHRLYGIDMLIAPDRQLTRHKQLLPRVVTPYQLIQILSVSAAGVAGFSPLKV